MVRTRVTPNQITLISFDVAKKCSRKNNKGGRLLLMINSDKEWLEKVKIRSLRPSDFFQLHRMYDSLDSKKTKPLFNLYWLGLQRRSFKWYIAQVLLFLSIIRICRKVMINLYPYGTILSMVAERNDLIIAYGFLLIGKRFSKNSSSVSLGIVVKDDYQRRGIGSKMMKALIRVAKREKMKEIFLTTRVDNLKAQKLYEKFGFSVDKLLKDEVEWQGKKHDAYRMSLLLE